MITPEQHLEIEARLTRNRKPKAGDPKLCCICGEPILDGVRMVSTDLSRARHIGCQHEYKPKSSGDCIADETSLEKAGWKRLGCDEWSDPQTGQRWPFSLACKIAEQELSRKSKPVHGRLTAVEGDILKNISGVEDEIRDLHKPIVEYCRGKGWIYFYSNPTRKTGRSLSEPDFHILADRSRVFHIECKSRSGELSPGQAALKCRALYLGHTIHVVYTMDQFYELVK